VALRGNLEAARRHLLVGRDAGILPDRAHIEQDADLASLRDEPWFREFLEGLESEPRARAGEAA
jgi:hypothetical protein